MNDHGHEDDHGDGHANGGAKAGGHQHDAHVEAGHAHDHGNARADWPVCPVCEMAVDPETSPSLDYQGTTYWFCNQRCKEDFEYKPSDYVTASPA